MILKFRTVCMYPVDGVEGEYGQEQWHFIDGITEATTGHDRERQCVFVRFMDANKREVELALHDEAYLLNDDGKTIEKVRC